MCAVAKREQTRWHSLAATVKSRRYKADGTAEAPGGNGTKVLASDDGDEALDSSPACATRRASSAMVQTETPARPCCCEIAADLFFFFFLSKTGEVGGEQRCGGTASQNCSKMLKRWLLRHLHSPTGYRGMEAELRCAFPVQSVIYFYLSLLYCFCTTAMLTTLLLPPLFTRGFFCERSWRFDAKTAPKLWALIPKWGDKRSRCPLPCEINLQSFTLRLFKTCTAPCQTEILFYVCFFA